MRERLNQVALTLGPLIFKGTNQSGSITTGSYPYEGQPVYGKTELMKDQLGRRKTNTCWHDSIVLTYPSLSATGYARTSNGSPSFVKEEFTGTCWIAQKSWNNAAWGLAEQDSLASIRTLSSEAVQGMWPEVESQISSLNFAIELPETKDILRTIKDYGLFLRNNKKSLRDVIRQLSAGHLTNEFGIQPLIGDIQGLSLAMRRARQDADRILRNENKDLVSHWRRWKTYPALTGYQTHFNDANGLTRFRLEVAASRGKYTATMRYRYRLPDYDRKFIYALAKLDALGLTLNAATVWNALPWSFVVDWVLRVGDFLDQFKVRGVEPIVEITDFCHSWRHEDLRTQYFEPRVNRNGCVPGVAAIRRHTFFFREKYVPDTYTSLRTSGISSREFILGGALFGARSSKR